VLGPDHPDTLKARNDIAVWTGETKSTEEALQLLRLLLADRERVLGPDHPDTLKTRRDISRLEPRLAGENARERFFSPGRGGET
jgi:hypothetical protein